jgi:hypothetical protein
MKMPVFLLISATSFVTIYSAQEIAAAIIVNTENETKTEVDPNRLPAKASKFISEKYEMTKISSVYEYLNTNGKITAFEVILKTPLGHKTQRFDANGNCLKK